MTNECIPYIEGAYTQKLTVHILTTAAVGKKFVGPLTSHQGAGPGLAADPLPTGDGGNLQCVGVPAAGGQVGGVAAWDGAVGGKGAVIRGAGTHLPVQSGAAVAVGDELKVDNQGRVLPATTGARVVGKAHSAVAGADLDVVVELYGPSAALAP